MTERIVEVMAIDALPAEAIATLRGAGWAPSAVEFLKSRIVMVILALELIGHTWL